MSTFQLGGPVGVIPETTSAQSAASNTILVSIPTLESSSVILGVVPLFTTTTEDANPTTLPSTPGVETTLQTARLVTSVELSSSAETSTSIGSQSSVTSQSSTSLGSSAPLSTQSSTSLESSTSLTTGAKAGIGVAAVIGAVLLMALGALISWAIRRQRRQKQIRNGIGISDTLDEPPTSESPKLEHGPVELPSAGVETQQLKGSGTDTHITRELDASGYSTNRRSRKELDGAHWRRELEGDTPNGTWTPTQS